MSLCLFVISCVSVLIDILFNFLTFTWRTASTRAPLDLDLAHYAGRRRRDELWIYKIFSSFRGRTESTFALRTSLFPTRITPRQLRMPSACLTVLDSPYSYSCAMSDQKPCICNFSITVLSTNVRYCWGHRRAIQAYLRRFLSLNRSPRRILPFSSYSAPLLYYSLLKKFVVRLSLSELYIYIEKRSARFKGLVSLSNVHRWHFLNNYLKHTLPLFWSPPAKRCSGNHIYHFPCFCFSMLHYFPYVIHSIIFQLSNNRPG